MDFFKKNVCTYKQLLMHAWGLEVELSEAPAHLGLFFDLFCFPFQGHPPSKVTRLRFGPWDSPHLSAWTAQRTSEGSAAPAPLQMFWGLARRASSG